MTSVSIEKSNRIELNDNDPIVLMLFIFCILFDSFTGNHKDYNKQRHKEPQSPCDESIIPPNSRVPLARSCSSPAASYGKCLTIYILFLNLQFYESFRHQNYYEFQCFFR